MVEFLEVLHVDITEWNAYLCPIEVGFSVADLELHAGDSLPICDGDYSTRDVPTDAFHGDAVHRDVVEDGLIRVGIRRDTISADLRHIPEYVD
jgi:hypothetical protein